MILINVKSDYFAYILCETKEQFDEIKKLFTRSVKKYNNWYKIYENIIVKHFTLVDNGTVIKVKAGLVDYLVDYLKKNNFKYILKDNRKPINIPTEFIFSILNEKVTLRNDQQSAVLKILKYKYCCVQLPTSSGKTEISASIIKTYLQCTDNRAVLYVVPTVKLQKEAEERFNTYNIPTNSKLPILLNKVNIITYMSLIKSSIDYRERDSVGCLIFDEAHHIAAKKSSKIVHDYKKLELCVGLSATITKDIETKNSIEDLDDADFNVFGCTGKPVYYKSIESTIEDKVITPIEIRVLNNPEQVYLSDYEISDWHLIKQKVLMSEKRVDLVARYTKHVLDDGNLNTICLLIPEVKWSQQYMLALSKYIKNARIILMYGGNEYDEVIEGKIKHLNKKEKQEAEQAIRNPEVKTIFSATTFFFEGINITNLQAIINVYGGRSTIRVKQQAGRVVRLFNDKNIAYIHEIYDKTPVLMSQLKARLNIYKKEYNAEIIKSTFI